MTLEICKAVLFIAAFHLVSPNQAELGLATQGGTSGVKQGRTSGVRLERTHIDPTIAKPDAASFTAATPEK